MFTVMFSLYGGVLGYCNVLNLPQKLESGINSYSQVEEEDIEGDGDGDADMSSVVKRVPTEIWDFGIESRDFLCIVGSFSLDFCK